MRNATLLARNGDQGGSGAKLIGSVWRQISLARSYKFKSPYLKPNNALAI